MSLFWHKTKLYICISLKRQAMKNLKESAKNWLPFLAVMTIVVVISILLYY
jgi:hypothetical protein